MKNSTLIPLFALFAYLASFVGNTLPRSSLPAIVLFFAFFACFAGQTPAECTLTKAESPKLLNLKLGMTPAEVNNALDRSVKVKVKTEGQYSYFKNYLKKGKAKRRLAGARALYLRFYKKRLYQAEIFYHADFRWNDLGSLVSDYSTENGFPIENWVTEHGYARADCIGFSVAADYVLNPRIELTDQEVVDKLSAKENE